ncbi:MAG: ATP-binding cassette domain-containing protein [Eubacteriales bacterium]|nr:ATP-binding cassette domain-containing protein [Eubacteriales bacterium]
MSLCVDVHKKLEIFSLDMQTEFPDAPTAVIGASGSGKSMLLRCIAGIIIPDSGKIVSNDTVWYDSSARILLAPQRRHAGYLFQQYALFENKTVAANIMLGMKGTKAEKKQACAVLMERFQLTGLAGHYPPQLSGGQKQRTALARMLAAKPDILLLDEPFSALDTYLRGQVRQQMADVLEQHTGVSLLVTHDFSEAMQLCPNAVVVSDGRIVEQGSCKTLWKQPKTRACAELTGMRNFFPIPKEMRARAEAACCLGIRPADFRPAREGDAVVFTGTVKRILPGIHADQIVLETVQGELLWDAAHEKVLLPQPGERISLSVGQENMHILKQ